TQRSLKSFFEHMNNRKFNASILESQYKDTNIVVNDLSIDMKLEEENDDLVLKMDSFENIIPLTSDGEYIFKDGKIYKLSEEWRKKIMPLYNEISSSRNEVLKIPNKYKEDFMSEVILNIKGLAKLDIDEK